MVIAPAKTGKDSNKRIVVIKIDHRNNDRCSKIKDLGRMLIIVVIKLIDLRIEETPAI